ncbi:hypothetical protein [Leuconostoc mesenteroides]|uniref:Uncharacterized protein n=1 Tax=Leuconostoc mesenteroides subsp. cremoris ATCC 19254 TaxID=586220 RepID=C2KJ81_LEUMC|nr:hypothetical protein [Leuconostoc mesenteroides]EEJ42704.1 hypothetical protein HMPREF0555_0697 [Leuconostoc mesenteroides subsp. cremoris ATCC 19254]MDG9751059.1 hypothetical protein [Leuconostoc mesenteroides]GEP16828.1 hypothetical protein LME05_15640 [Leuconostoc mesenteroides subsp. cremoris]
MNITVNEKVTNFVDKKEVLKYASVQFNSGQFPNSLNGNLQVTSSDGITVTATEDEIIAAAKKRIQALIAETPAKTTEV